MYVEELGGYGEVGGTLHVPCDYFGGSDELFPFVGCFIGIVGKIARCVI